MTSPVQRPELVINYSPSLDLRITFAEFIDYGGAALPEYRFAMDCCWRRCGGDFRYSADNVYFGEKAFARFAEELRGVQQGLRQEAVLKDPGDLIVLRLERKSNILLATFDVRVCVPPSTAELHVVLEADYDLFVNKLLQEVERFVGELRDLGFSPRR